MERKQQPARALTLAANEIEEKMESRLSDRAKTLFAAVGVAVTVLGALFAALGSYYTHQTQDEERIRDARERQTQTEQAVKQIQVDVIETRSDVKWIMRRLGK